MSASVSVVVPTRNRPAQAAATVASLGDDPAVLEVVLVDDGSSPEAAQALDDLAREDPRVRVVRTAGRGPGVAREAGVRAAVGDVVLFLDDDVVASPALASGHARHHDHEPGLVVLGYMPTTEPDSDAADDIAVILYARDYAAQVGRYESDPGEVLRNLWAGNVSLRRADALAVGMHPAYAIPRHEDRDFGLRCLRHGLRGTFDRSLAAEHRPTRDFAAFRRVSFEQGQGVVVLHAQHADLIGAAVPAAGAELPGPIRPIRSAATVPGVGRAVIGAAGLAVRVLGRLHALRRVQIGAAVLVRVMENRRGQAAAPLGQPGGQARAT